MNKNFKKYIVISFIITLISSIYINLGNLNFRISASVVLLPILFVTIGLRLSIINISFLTAFFVLIARFIFIYDETLNIVVSLKKVFPPFIFYIAYGFLFLVFVKNRFTENSKNIAIAATKCDFIANLIEIFLENLLFEEYVLKLSFIYKIFIVSLIRGMIVYLILNFISSYYSILKEEKHEKHYRRLFLIIASIKSEIYLMKKNSEQIENVMKDAYNLYESMLNYKNIPDEMKITGLDIAREVHEIKKDYLRIIQGLEEEIGKDTNNQKMKISDIVKILIESENTYINSKSLKIIINSKIDNNVIVKNHYTLLSLLNNLVHNAVEAIEMDSKKGEINIHIYEDEEYIIFEVKDNGPGILQKNLTKIFQIGYSTKFNEQTGNMYRGVGLSGVKRIINDYFKGNITVTSQPKKETKFIVKIKECNL